MEPEIDATEHPTPAMLAQAIRDQIGQLYVDCVWVRFPRSRHRVTPETADHVCRGLMVASELAEMNSQDRSRPSRANETLPAN